MRGTRARAIREAATRRWLNMTDEQRALQGSKRAMYRRMKKRARADVA